LLDFYKIYKFGVDVIIDLFIYLVELFYLALLMKVS